MNKLLLTFVLTLTCAGATAQITMRQTPIVDKPIMRPEPFDSLTNLVNERQIPVHKGESPNIVNFKRYIGQQIFFLPKSSRADAAAKNKGQVTQYFCFYNLDLKSTDFNYTYSEKNYVRGREKIEQKTKVFKTDCYKAVFRKPDMSGRYYFYTPADSVEGRYFVIMDVQAGSVSSRWGSWTAKEEEFTLHDLNAAPLSGESEAKYSGRSVSIIVTLQPVAGGEPFLMVIPGRYDYCDRGEYHTVDDGNSPPPMLLVSFFERMQHDHVGKDFVAKSEIKNLVDINTGQLVTIPFDSQWKCTDLSLMELSAAYMQPYFVLENETSAVKFLLKSPSDIDAERLFPYAFISKERYDELERKRKLDEEQREKERLELEQRRIEAKKQFQADCLAVFGPTYGKYIINGQVIVGMTADMCEAAWGSPRWINTTVVNGLRHEQWVYEYGNYLYFDNGKLTAIQQHM